MEDLVVRIGDGLNQEVTGLFSLVEQLGGNLLDRILGTHGLVMPVDRLHGDEIDDTGKFGFGTNLNIDGNSTCAEAVDDGRGRIDGVRTGLVHLIDETNAGDFVLVGLTPDGLR